MTFFARFFVATKIEVAELAEARRHLSMKVSALSRMAQFRLARWTNRRQIEWKTSASIWAFLVAIASAIAFQKISIPLRLLIVFLTAIFGLHYWWVRQNWIRNQEDIKAAFDYHEQIANLLSIPMAPRVRRGPSRSIFNDAVPTFEFTVTALLIAAILAVRWTVQEFVAH